MVKVMKGWSLQNLCCCWTRFTKPKHYGLGLVQWIRCITIKTVYFKSQIVLLVKAKNVETSKHICTSNPAFS